MVLGVIGFMKPALGVRFTAGLPAFLGAAFLAAGFLAGAAAFFTAAFFTAGFFAAGFLAAGFFVVAMLGSPVLGLHFNRFRKHSSIVGRRMSEKYYGSQAETEYITNW
jgi:hypothetical protein